MFNQSTDKGYCSECNCVIERMEDVCVLTHAGPGLSLRPLCEPCCDKLLADWQQRP